MHDTMKGNGTYFLEYCWPKNRSPLSKDPDAHRDEIYSIRQLSKDPEVHSIRQKSIQHAAIYKNEPHAFVKSMWVVDDVIMMTSSWTNQCGLCLVHAPTCPPSWIMKARFLMTSSSNRYTHKTFNSDDIIMNQSAWHLSETHFALSLRRKSTSLCMKNEWLIRALLKHTLMAMRELQMKM